MLGGMGFSVGPRVSPSKGSSSHHSLLIVLIDLISAGIILVFTDIDVASFSAVGLANLEAAWQRCLETLHRMIDVHPSARDYALALRALKQRQISSASHGTCSLNSP